MKIPTISGYSSCFRLVFQDESSQLVLVTWLLLAGMQTRVPTTMAPNPLEPQPKLNLPSLSCLGHGVLSQKQQSD